MARSFPLALLRELLFQFNSVIMGYLDSAKSSPGGWGPCFWHTEFKQLARSNYFLMIYLIGPLKMAAFELVWIQVVIIALSHEPGALAWQKFMIYYCRKTAAQCKDWIWLWWSFIYYTDGYYGMQTCCGVVGVCLMSCTWAAIIGYFEWWLLWILVSDWFPNDRLKAWTH